MQSYVIIGAGILGASTAYHLARQGATVTLIDRSHLGQATNAAAGIICPWLTNRSNKAWYKLVLAGAKYYPKLVDDLNADGITETGYAKVGAINVFDTEEKLDKKMEVAERRKQSAPEMGEISRLTPTETNKLFPPLSNKFWSIHISGAARVNGVALRDALIEGAKRWGTRLIHGDAKLIHEGSAVKGAIVNNERIFGEKVIVTAGIWAKELLDPLGVKFKVNPQKAQIIHLKVENVDTSRWPVVLPPYNQYMLTFDDGRIVIGATQEDEAGRDPRVTVKGVSEILDKALKVAPGLAACTYIETKVGFRPFTPGSLPVCGPVPNFEGLLAANGLGASGLTSGPYLGAQLANMALGNTTEIDEEDYPVSGACHHPGFVE